MSLARYSENQLFAIEKIKQSLVLSAGAGAGKTGVLVQRYLQLLKEHENHDSIVAITFTRKAAAEMRERVGEELLRSLEEAEEQGSIAQIQQQILLLPTANIGTIHGFCSTIIRSYPIEAKVDPNFILLEEYESRGILEFCIRKELASALQKEPERAFFLLQNKSTAKAVEKLRAFLEKIIGKGIDPEKLKPDLEKDGNTTTELRSRFNLAINTLKGQKLNFDKKGTKAIERFVALTSISVYTEHDFLSLPFKEQTRWFKNLSDTLDEYEKKREKALSKNDQLLFDLLSELNFFQIYQNLWEDWLKDIYSLAYDLLIGAYYLFQEEKRKQKALDFGDLEHLTLHLLQNNPKIIENLQHRYRAFLVDEFQDTNYSQFEIICLINSGRMAESLFVAGDIKQSIYGFRGAVADLFAEITNLIEESVSPETSGHKVLEANYRSAPQLIDFVNAYFEPQMESYIPMTKVRRLPKTLPAAELLLNSGEKSEDSRQQEALAVARRIKEMVEEKEELVFESINGEERAKAVQYRDIALLFRSRTSLDLYVDALKEANVPYLVLGNRAFYQRPEIQILLIGLGAVAQPDDEYAAWGWLSAPFHNIPLAALAQHALSCQNDKLQFLQSPWRGPTACKEAWQKAINNLKNWQDLQAYISIDTLLQKMIDNCNLDIYFAQKPLGEQAWTNIQKLVALSKETGGQKFDGIHEALAFFKVLAQEESEAELTLFGENQNAVRIMTIHAAKGLEFPVLFLPDLIRKLSVRIEEDLLWTPAEGLSFTFGTAKGRSLREEALSQEAKEAQRVFYVALTRARDYLVLAGPLEKYTKQSYWGHFIAWLSQNEALPTVEELLNHPKGLIKNLQGLEFLFRLENKQSEKEEIVPLRLQIEGELDLPEQLVFENLPEIKNVVLDLTPLQKKVAPAERDAYRVSATALLEYRLCPRRYYMRYRLWLKPDPFPPLDGSRSLKEDIFYDRREEEGKTFGEEETIKSEDNPLLFGSFIHYLCEVMDSHQDDDDLLDSAFALPQFSSLLKRRPEAKNILAKMRTDANYIKLLQEAQSKEKEYQFLVPISERVYLEGLIDLILVQKDGSLKLLDYKTNRVHEENLEQVASNYILQLQWYALALEKLWQQKITASFLYFTRLPQLVSVDTSKEALDEALTQLTALSLAVEKGNDSRDFPKNINKHCHTCPYLDLCLSFTERSGI